MQRPNLYISAFAPPRGLIANEMNSATESLAGQWEQGAARMRGQIKKRAQFHNGPAGQLQKYI